MISAKIQKDIWRKVGIYSTVGMSNSNPLFAKLALDNEAKKMPIMRANWFLEDLERNRPITRYIEKGSKVLSTLEPFSIYILS